MDVYFISGIGADERLFTHLHLPEGFNARHIAWVEPLRKETIPQYAARLARLIDTSKPFVVVGLSLGGIMASEIAKIHRPALTILISTAAVAAQLPPYYRLARHLRLMKVLPGSFFKLTAITKHALTMRSKSNRRLVYKVIWSGSNRFIQWGMNAVLYWDNQVLPEPYIHIHGTSDEVFPIRYTKPTHIIKGGGHMLVLNHPERINLILKQALQELPQNPA